MKRVVWVVIAVVIVVVLAVMGGLALYGANVGDSRQPAGAAFEPTEAVEVVEAREVPWQPTADLVGTVFAVRSVMVRNELAGVVTAVGFQSGSVVEEGQVILTQDDAVEQADLEAWARVRNSLSHAPPEQANPGPLIEDDVVEYKGLVEHLCARWRTEMGDG